MGCTHVDPASPSTPTLRPNAHQSGAALPSSGATGGGGAASSAAAAPSGNNPASRQSRRLYVGGIPAGVAEQALVDHFNAQMMAANLLAAPGPPVISAQINVERGFAFLEFRSTEETTNCLAFDGMIVQGNALKIKRPKDYMPPVGEPEPVCGLSPFFFFSGFFFLRFPPYLHMSPPRRLFRPSMFPESFRPTCPMGQTKFSSEDCRHTSTRSRLLSSCRPLAR